MLKKSFLILSFIILSYFCTMLFHSIDESPRFVAISNLLYDRILKVSPEFLEDSILPIVPNMKINQTTWINAKQSEMLKNVITQHKYEYSGSGGSAANTIVALSFFGEKVGLVGALADDSLGELYKQSLKSKEIQYRITSPRDHSSGSGNCTVLVTNKENNERTMLTNLGVSSDVVLSNQDLAFILKAECLIVEGYFFEDTTYPVIHNAAEQMKKNKKKVALNLSADFCVRNYLEKIKHYIENYVDIIIGNDSEMKILTGKESISEMVSYLQSKGLVGAITCGSKGAYVFNKKQIVFIEKPDAPNLIDTTGAGDLFFAGLLYGLFNGMSIEASGRLGARCAGEIIQSWGAQPTKLSRFKELLSQR